VIVKFVVGKCENRSLNREWEKNVMEHGFGLEVLAATMTYG
jgi:hypothetical protein